MWTYPNEFNLSHLFPSSAFVIGSIDDLNRRIGRLDRQLASYNELVCDSRASDLPDYLALTGDLDEKGRQQVLKKGTLRYLCPGIWTERFFKRRAS